MPKAPQKRASRARSGPLTATAVKTSRKSARDIKEDASVDKEELLKEEPFVHENVPPYKEEPVKRDEYIKEERFAQEEKFVQEEEKSVKAEGTVKEEREMEQHQHIHGLQQVKEETLIKEENKDVRLAPPGNYLFLVRLRLTTDPPISRFLSVPSHFTFEQFHEVLQVAFGWANYHMYTFKVSRLPENGEVSFNSPLISQQPNSQIHDADVALRH